MATVEVSRTLVKSPPELWTELQGDRLPEALGGASVRATQPERELEWETEGAHGKAVIEESGWGTKVTLTAEVEEEVRQLEPKVASLGLWERLRRIQPPPSPPPSEPPRHEEIERRLEQLLDELGSAHRKPFQGS